MSDCIFCKIIRKEIPATVVFEDDDVLVFMDIGPIVKGHALVTPKKHYDPITETPDAIVAKLHLTAKRVAAAQMNAFGADGVNIMQNNGAAAGQEVEHIHVHVIPRFSTDGHHWNWNAKKYDDFSEMNKLAEDLRKHL
ncbi:HIT family protein [Pontiellaceae bacterium B12219]|nr:HIT family protein [Pontiellaceae bacterium B12219]